MFFFRLQICETAFSTSTQLKVHTRSHTGEKPYFCDKCKKAFTTSGGLNRHKRQQHDSNMKVEISNANNTPGKQNVIIIDNSQLICLDLDTNASNFVLN